MHSALRCPPDERLRRLRCATPEQAKRQVENAVRLICEVERQRTLCFKAKFFFLLFRQVKDRFPAETRPLAGQKREREYLKCFLFRCMGHLAQADSEHLRRKLCAAAWF